MPCYGYAFLGLLCAALVYASADVEEQADMEVLVETDGTQDLSMSEEADYDAFFGQSGLLSGLGKGDIGSGFLQEFDTIMQQVKTITASHDMAFGNVNDATMKQLMKDVISRNMKGMHKVHTQALEKMRKMKLSGIGAITLDLWRLTKVQAINEFLADPKVNARLDTMIGMMKLWTPQQRSLYAEWITMIDPRAGFMQPLNNHLGENKLKWLYAVGNRRMDTFLKKLEGVHSLVKYDLGDELSTGYHAHMGSAATHLNKFVDLKVKQRTGNTPKDWSVMVADEMEKQMPQEAEASATDRALASAKAYSMVSEKVFAHSKYAKKATAFSERLADHIDVKTAGLKTKINMKTTSMKAKVGKTKEEWKKKSQEAARKKETTYNYWDWHVRQKFLTAAEREFFKDTPTDLIPGIPHPSVAEKVIDTYLPTPPVKK